MLTARTLTACAAGALALSCSLPALAGPEALLASFAYTGIGQSSALAEWKPFLSYGEPFQPGSVTMNNITMDLADIAQGNHYDLEGDLAAFNEFAGDGFDQPIYIGFTVPSGTGSQLFTGEFPLLQNAFFRAPGVGTPDFEGYTITRIEVLGTSWSSLDAGQWEVTTQFHVYGVPTPGAGTALAIAGVMALGRRRR